MSEFCITARKSFPNFKGGGHVPPFPTPHLYRDVNGRTPSTNKCPNTKTHKKTAILHPKKSII